MKRLRSESGAAAVEFALVVPLLLVLLLGIIEFGRVYNAQIQVTTAAREAVRVMAIENKSNLAVAAAISSTPGLSPSLTSGQIAVGSCTSGTKTTTVTVTYSVDLLSGLFADAVSLTGRSAMRCGG
ncbi:TadE/TadG family type IV pilus assembly protein [Arthrobacter sp. CAN_A1]|uniref:TadE/TadG family type IV pilus assembly protein n=1 Tax=Arthrobacter sp. CAN_A1 TaxID=2787717 RepID=UPI0018C95C97